MKIKTLTLLMAFATLPLTFFAADVTGTWKSEFESQIGRQNYVFTFKQDGTNLTGKANSEVGEQKREAELKEGRVEGNTISFIETLNLQDNEIRISYTGKLSADANEITFTRAVGDIAKYEIVAKREQAASAAADSNAKIIRIKAGQPTPFTDSSGNVWLAEQGFEGGDTTGPDPAPTILGTRDPSLFLTEHYAMDSFSTKLPNGKYVARLYFAETYQNITGPGERVFSFNVQGHEFKDFDVFKIAGGANRAYMEAVPVEVTNGIFKIIFTSNIENPQINAIEIVPAALAETTPPRTIPITAPAQSAPAVPATPATPEPVAPAPPADAVSSPSATPVLKIDAGKVLGEVSPRLYGLMTEEINFSYEGGLYAELIRNRTFKSNPRNPDFWDVVGGAMITIDTNQPLNSALDLSLKVDANQASEAAPAGIANRGYWGIPVRPNMTYHASFYARSEDFSGPLNLSIESADGKTLFASAKVSKIAGEWKKYEVTLKTKEVAPSKENRFAIKTSKSGTIWFQNVSLFPPTYNNRPNGSRTDIMQLMAGMQPKFLRFPGGNYVEGNTIPERFNWKETIGDVAQRPGHRSPWGYWSTDGFGLLEFLEWCEDLKMEPVLAVYAGYSLRQQHVDPGSNLVPYVQDALDEIEYATGDAHSKWGAERAKDGHPKPFKLNFVEIGNEDFFDRSHSYDGRFTQFYDAIKQKYPNLQIIATTPVKTRTPDLVDEHYYRSQEDMMAHALDYDKYSRTNQSKVFCGEWATRVGSPTPNMAGALGDAAWMTGMERNSDIVLMHCYAPLLVNVSRITGQNRSMQWSTDLIGYDALNSYGSPAYYAQRMFSAMHGDEILATDSQDIPMRSWQPPARRGGNPPPPQELRQVFFDATRDSKTGVVYVKVVNESGTAQRVNFQINGAKTISSKGEAIVLAADSPNDTNSLNEPDKIVPRAESFDGVSAEFTRELPAYSITVVKLQTK